MLSIFADALLIAARGVPLRPDEPARRADPERDRETMRRWMASIGGRD
ncbi:hypothetical protein LHP98_07105 [Rhodobacter sp. Har01]|nr:hypothetical protein [Rhodobacter sp. Har01]MCB6177896.1 hypothetical protein [Rhodobacter sp. Har01]